MEDTQLAPSKNCSTTSADGRVATEAAWLNGEKREELMERAKKLSTWIGLLMEGPTALFRVADNPVTIRDATSSAGS
jgi:hypothetical protein